MGGPPILYHSENGDIFVWCFQERRVKETVPFLELGLEQVGNHLATSDDRGAPQGREIQGAEERVCVSEEEHGRDPAASVLKGEAALGHPVLLDVAAAEVVHASGGVDLGLKLAGDVGRLGARQDMKVIICCMAACVAFCADCGAC